MINLNKIGKVQSSDGVFKLSINEEYKSALEGLDEFQYIQVIWWFDKVDNEENRSLLLEEKPYKKGPDKLGVFATRSPNRPNPIAITTVYVIDINKEKGIITIPYIDAMDGTPILDIKPYMPSIDRVESIQMPEWCSNWPKCYEESGDFNWSKEFNF